MFHVATSSKRTGTFRGDAARWKGRGLAVGGALGFFAATVNSCSDPKALEGLNVTGGTGAAGPTGGSGGAPGGSGLVPNAGAGGTNGDGAGTGSSTGGTIGGAGAANSGGAGTAGVGTGGMAGTSLGGTSAGGGSGPTGGSGAGAPGGLGGSGAGRGGAGAGGSGIAGGGGSAPGDRGTPVGVCARWNSDRADLNEGTWSGSVATCTAGDISANGRANALRLFNLYRWLADLPAVQTEASRDAQAQACALMQQANRASGLSHEPPMSWTCWTQLGADGSSSSNISSGPGVSSVDAYMLDNGNETTFGHRRIVLSNELGPIGLGSTGPMGASCMQNLRGTGRAGKTWMAWPAPGIIPLQAIRRSTNSSLDRTGWSVQSNTIDVTAATVTITAGGTNQPVTKSNLTGSYGGARYAIRIVPNGWQTAAGTTYTVNLAGTLTPITYAVEVVDCAM